MCIAKLIYYNVVFEIGYEMVIDNFSLEWFFHIFLGIDDLN